MHFSTIPSSKVELKHYIQLKQPTKNNLKEEKISPHETKNINLGSKYTLDFDQSNLINLKPKINKNYKEEFT